MTSNDRNNRTVIDYTSGLSRLDRLCNLTMPMDKRDRINSPRFASLKISTNTNYIHLQSRTSRCSNQSLPISAIFDSAHRKAEMKVVKALSK